MCFFWGGDGELCFLHYLAISFQSSYVYVCMYYVYTYMYVHVYPSKSLSFSCLSPCSLPLYYPSYSHLILLENPTHKNLLYFPFLMRSLFPLVPYSMWFCIYIVAWLSLASQLISTYHQFPSLLSISPPAVSLHTTLRLDFECRLFMSLVLPPESFLFVLNKLQLIAFHPERQCGEPLRC